VRVNPVSSLEEGWAGLGAWGAAFNSVAHRECAGLLALQQRPESGKNLAAGKMKARTRGVCSLILPT